MRRRARVDSTQGEIVRTLRAAGFNVVDLSRVGGGVPDLMVGGRGGTWLVEAKSPGRMNAENAAGTLTAQRGFRDTWRGCPVIVATSGVEALRAMGVTS